MSDDETNEAEEAGEDAPDTEVGNVEMGNVEMRYGAVVDIDAVDVVLHTDPEQLLEVATAAKDDGFDQLIDLTAVDYLTYGGARVLPAGVDPQRYEVVVQLINHISRERLRIRVQVPADGPVVPTLFDLWPGSETLEREVYDMFGIEFADHPDMSRILMPDDWVGHPLRKDYAVGSIPVQFKSASNIR